MSPTIVVPLDGSSLADRAMPYATALARATGARLVLVRAPSPRELWQAPEGSRGPTAELEDAATMARAEGVEAEPYLYPIYLPEEVPGAIVDAAVDRHADLIVMSTNGRSGLGRWLWGSVADQVLRRAEVPVLLIPATCERSWAAGEPRRILVSLDGSPLAEEALDPARELAAALGTDLLLLQVVDLSGPDVTAGHGAATIEAGLANARRYLDAIVARLEAAGASVSVRLEVGLPARVIAAVAHEQGAGLIAMATHGRSGLTRAILGSVATGVLQRATVPLLLVRPATAEPAAATRVTPTVAEQPPAPIELTDRERYLVQRGLAELAFAPGHPPELAESARALLARLKQVTPPTGVGAAMPPTAPGPEHAVGQPNTRNHRRHEGTILP